MIKKIQSTTKVALTENLIALNTNYTKSITQNFIIRYIKNKSKLYPNNRHKIKNTNTKIPKPYVNYLNKF